MAGCVRQARLDQASSKDTPSPKWQGLPGRHGRASTPGLACAFEYTTNSSFPTTSPPTPHCPRCPEVPTGPPGHAGRPGRTHTQSPLEGPSQGECPAVAWNGVRSSLSRGAGKGGRRGGAPSSTSETSGQGWHNAGRAGLRGQRLSLPAVASQDPEEVEQEPRLAPGSLCSLRPRRRVCLFPPHRQRVWQINTSARNAWRRTEGQASTALSPGPPPPLILA